MMKLHGPALFKQVHSRWTRHVLLTRNHRWQLDAERTPWVDWAHWQ